MEEALGADGHGFLEQHDALIGLVAEELQGGEAAGRRHVEMLPAARGYDKAFCCAHVGVLPCGGMSRYFRYGPTSPLPRGAERADHPVAQLVHPFQQVEGSHARDAWTV